MQKATQKALVFWVLFTAGLGLAVSNMAFEPLNAPRELSRYDQNTLFSSFSGTSPKTLDPQVSYSNDETPYTYHVYDTLYSYHYLKRPYEIVPRVARALPQVAFLDARGKALSGKAAAEAALTRFTIPIRKGVRFAPHPCFATDERGWHPYFELDEATAQAVASPLDLPEKGTRELTSEDFVYGVKRLARPWRLSPVFTLMAQSLPGLKKLYASLSAFSATHPGVRPDLRRFDLPGVSAPDAHTLVIEVAGYQPQFVNWLAMAFFSPVPWEADRFYEDPRLRKKNISMDTWPVGSGPYMLVSSRENREHVLAKNPNYRDDFYPCEGAAGDDPGLLAACGRKLPFIDRIVMTLEKESAPVSIKFLSGYYDSPQITRLDVGQGFVVSAQDSPDKARLYAERKLVFPASVEASSWYMGFNWLDPVVGRGDTVEQMMRNRLLRQAISIAVDWQEYIAIFEKGQGQVAHGVLPPGLAGYDPEGRTAFNPVVFTKDAKGRPVRRSVFYARELMRLAGYPGGIDEATGKPLVLNFDWQGTAAGSKAFLDWMRRQFDKIDIALEIRATDYNRFQDKMIRGAAQIFFWGWLADYPDPENFLFLLYGKNAKVPTGGAGENAANFADPRYDELFEAMRLAPPGKEKNHLIDEMTVIVQNEAPWSFGYFPTAVAAHHHWVKNLKPTQMIRNNLMYLEIDARERAAYIRAYNRPVLWPVVLVLGALGLLLHLAYLRFKAKAHEGRT